MKTVFKVGMEVYDEVFFGKAPLKITEVKGDMTLRVLCGGVTYCYTGDGRFIGDDITSNRHRGLSQTPTLSTKPYFFDGFEQKAPVPTYEKALKEAHRKDEYYYLPNDLEAPSEELANATVALLKLLFLRDYYNEGWQPDLKNKEQRGVSVILDSEGNFFVWGVLKETETHALVFKDEKVAKRFIEEQRELLEIAKPLL